MPQQKPARLTPSARVAQQAQQHAQKWLPFQTVQDGCLIRQDGAVVAGLKIAPFNLSLKSERETQGIIQHFQAALNGLNVPWQWVSLYRPVDLDAYLGTLDDRQNRSQGIRRQILRDYQGWVRHQAHSGQQVERRYYCLMTRQGKEAMAEHRATLRGFLDDVARIRGFQATVLDDALWRELLFLVFHADQAAEEAIPDGLPQPIPLYRPQEVFV